MRRHPAWPASAFAGFSAIAIASRQAPWAAACLFWATGGQKAAFLALVQRAVRSFRLRFQADAAGHGDLQDGPAS